MTNELKPCPFCGSEAKLFTARGKCNQIVRCLECNVSPGYRQTKKEAIEAWNTRAERTCHNKSRFAPGGTRFICSACDFGSDWDMWNEDYGVPMDFWFDYCPICGAKVVEE